MVNTFLHIILYYNDKLWLYQPMHQGSILSALTNLADDIDLLVFTTNQATSICQINQPLHQLDGSIVRQSCGMRCHFRCLLWTQPIP